MTSTPPPGFDTPTTGGVLGFDHRWTFYAVEIATGRVVSELMLANVKAQIRLTSAGSFSAELPVTQYSDPVIIANLLQITTPGKYSVVVDLDGQIVGEFAIWTRERDISGNTVNLSGLELVSLLDHRMMWDWAWTGVEQLDIAKFLAQEGFTSALGYVTAAMTFPPYTPSGVPRDRNTYKKLDGSIGQRLRELSQVDNGFDYYVHNAWAQTSQLVVQRSFTMAYPRAGVDQAFTFELAGNLATGKLTEDASSLASRAFALGATTNNVPLIGERDDLTLVNQGYPLLDRSGSWTSVTAQSTINDYAQALLVGSQTGGTNQPLVATVFADVDPMFGQYGLGDRVQVVIHPVATFPNGYSSTVRIVGWDLAPDVTTPPTINLVLTGADLTQPPSGG